MNKNKFKPFILLFIAVLSLSVIFFTACDPGSYRYDVNNLRAPVKAIELVNYDNPDQKHFLSWVPNHESDLKPLDLTAIETTAKLEADRIDGFMADLAEQHILYKYYAFDSPNGTCIKIVYEDDCFDIISCNDQSFTGYIGTFSSDGKVVEFIGCFSGRPSFEFLLQTYFGI